MIKSAVKMVVLAIFIVSGICGCSAPKPVQKADPVFFPMAPNPPRIQFLMGIQNSQDVEGKKDDYALFMFGRKEAERVRWINKPYGVKVFKNKIYLCDSGAANIIILDLVNKKFDFLKGNYGFGKLKKPINLELDGEGNLYVTDTAREEVVMYDSEGNFLRTFGQELGMRPVDLLVDEESLYVLDLKSGDIKVLDLQDGHLVRTIGDWTEPEKMLHMPLNLTFGEDKRAIFVTNSGIGNVVKMDRDGHFLDSFGRLGDGFGEFGRPRGIAIDSGGRFYVADASHQNVQIFNETGRLLVFFGDPGLPRGSMNLPAGVVVTRDNLDYFQKLAAPGFILEDVVIVTNQFGRDKVAVYGVGEMEGAQGSR